jgi:hypothetical protein
MYWIHSNSLLIVYQQYHYRVWQKNVTIWHYSSEQNHWCGDVAFEGTSSMTQGISVITEHWPPSHLPCGDLFQKQQFSCRNLLLRVAEKCQRNINWKKKKTPGRQSAAGTLEIMERVCQAVISPWLSVSRNTLALRMSDHTVHLILHHVLNFHP